MQIDIIELINSSDALLLFTALAFGLLVGKIRFGSFEVGATTGVLLISLLLGHFGFGFTQQTISLGFMLFIFCVGIEAGPNFFSTFIQDGVKYVVLAAVVALSAVVAVRVLAEIFGFGSGLSAGILAGALTSTPTLVGAQDAIANQLDSLEYAEKAKLLSDLSVGYAIAYIIGLVGLLVSIRYIPSILRVDLKKEARKALKEKGLVKVKGHTTRNLTIRACLITKEIAEKIEGRSLRRIGAYEEHGVMLEKIKRGNKIIEPSGDEVLQEGDRVSYIGYPEAHEKVSPMLNSEIFDADLIDLTIARADVVAKNSEYIGKSLADVKEQAEDFGCIIEGLTRAQLVLPLSNDMHLNRGDLLHISGESSRVQQFAEKIGFVDKHGDISDLVSFSFFFIIGLFLGQLSLQIGNLNIGLGQAGGLLFAGILMGYLRANNPGHGHVPQGAINILKDLGLNIFMVGVGLNAGNGIAEAFLSVGPIVVLAAAIIMLVPVVISYLVGVYLLKINKAMLLGAITGSMTSTPALNIVNEAADSNAPALGYAGTYTFANVFLTLAGAFVITLI